MVIGLISGGLALIGIGQGLRLLLLILGKALRRQALDWCAAHYPDLSIKEDRPGSKRLSAKKSASTTVEQ